ncbi:MAG TPA: MFS transporter [Candidatus Obscuribacterales bacterium]
MFLKHMNVRANAYRRAYDIGRIMSRQSFWMSATQTKEAPAAAGIFSQPHEFVRDRLTWAGYFLYGYFSFVWAAFGAFVPYLRTELNIALSIAALHFSALALGPFISGFVGDIILRRLGEAKTIVTGVSIMLSGVILTMVGVHPAVTIGGAFLIGFGGAIMGQSVTVVMTERFGQQRALAITEFQIAGSLCSLFAPVAVGFVTKAGFNWRAALLSSLAVLAVFALGNLQLTKRIDRSSTSRGKAGASALKPLYWLYFAVIFFSVASEWSVAFWTPEYLQQVLNISKADAAMGMSTFLLGMFLGRIVGVGLLRRFPVSLLLPASATTAALGFIIFWLSRDLWLSLVGLLLLGLGESNVYPLAFSSAIGAVSGSPDKATVRISLSTGSAILIAPLTLGCLADHVGIGISYGLVAALLVLAAVAVYSASYFSRERTP